MSLQSFIYIRPRLKHYCSLFVSEFEILHIYMYSNEIGTKILHHGCRLFVSDNNSHGSNDFKLGTILKYQIQHYQ